MESDAARKRSSFRVDLKGHHWRPGTRLDQHRNVTRFFATAGQIASLQFRFARHNCYQEVAGSNSIVQPPQECSDKALSSTRDGRRSTRFAST